MKTLANASPFSLLFAGAIVGLASAFACSSSSGSGATGSPECTSLTTCCLGMGTAAAIAECNAIVATGNEATCTSSLISYTTTGACTAGTGPADAGHIFGFDSGIPCQTTGTCTTTNDAGHVTGFDAGASTVCSGAVACSNGQTYEQCESTATGTCTAEVVFSGGQSFACPSCGDCTSALALAASQCGTTTTPDAGHTADAGVDADVCGTPPALHPETAAGVYCPFTSGGNVHCTAGQQCCEAPSTSTDGSTCETTGTTCPIAGSIQWECDGPVDCAASSNGPICCGNVTVTEDLTCNYDRGSGLTLSHCATSCAAGEVSICSESTDPCSSGTCTAFKVAGVVVGTCM